jgi:hypothetical protein
MSRDPAPSPSPQPSDLHALTHDQEKLTRRVVELERQVRFLMARLTSDELERYERVEG